MLQTEERLSELNQKIPHHKDSNCVVRVVEHGTPKVVHDKRVVCILFLEYKILKLILLELL